MTPRNFGYAAGHSDAQEGKIMTEVQLGYHSDDYAHGYRAGYADVLNEAEEIYRQEKWS